MAGNYSHTTRASGLTLTAAIYNGDHENHITNSTPAGLDDYSSNATEMKVHTDPGEVGSESLPTSLAGELERLRYAIREIKGGDQWYETGTSINNSITAGSTQTQAGATALTTHINRVTVVGTNGDGVALPTAVKGLDVTIINDDAAQSIQVWPATSDKINGGSADAVDAESIFPGSSRRYVAVDDTDWYRASPADFPNSAFLVYNSANDNNVTGAGTQVTVDFDTEVFDQGNEFASDTFTATHAGKYDLTAAVLVKNLVSASLIVVELTTSNRTYQSQIPGSVDGDYTLQTGAVVDMDAGDTAVVKIAVSGMAGDTADIIGGAGTLTTWFAGARVA